MNAGDGGSVFINQAWRDAACLAVAGDRALVEYEMPNGRTYLLDVPAAWPLTRRADWPQGFGMHVRNIQAKRAPARWRDACAPMLAPVCRWFALCTRPATTSVPHPVLGDVPCCAQCAAFATGGAK